MNGSTSTSGKGNMIWGILMLICGFLAIALPFVSGIGVAIVIGWVLLATGVWHLLFGFRSGSGIGGFLWQLLLAIVYGAAGLMAGGCPRTRTVASLFPQTFSFKLCRWNRSGTGPMRSCATSPFISRANRSKRPHASWVASRQRSSNWLRTKILSARRRKRSRRCARRLKRRIFILTVAHFICVTPLPKS